MREIEDLLEELNAIDEHAQIEAKTTGSQLGESILETICAFSNEPDFGGGYLILGITRTENGYTATGVTNPDKIQNDLTTLCAQKFSIPLRPHITVKKLPNNKALIAVFIEEQVPQLKPVTFEKKTGTKNHSKIRTVAYRRIGSADVLCTPEDYELFTALKQNRPYDETTIPHTTFADIDKKAIAEYRRLRAKINPDAAELTCSDEDLLLCLRCAEKTTSKINHTGDHTPDTGLVLTTAGLLLFGNEAALRRYFPLMRFDYIRTDAKTWDEMTLESHYVSLEYREALMTLLPKAETAIMSNIEKKVSTNTNSLAREEQPILPRGLIREALINAVMHRDYRVNGPVIVVQYPDRIEFFNHGYSLKPIENLTSFGGSKSRNPTIATVFHDIEYAENKGTGISKMIGLMHAVNLEEPVFLSDRDKNTFKAKFYMHQLLTEDMIAWLKQFSSFHLTPHEAQVLAFTLKKNAITNEDGRELTGLDTLSVSRLLTNLRKKGLLVQHSAGPKTHYTIHMQYLLDNADSGGMGADLGGKDIDLAGKDADLAGKDIDSGGKKQPHDENIRRSLLSGLPTEIITEIEHLGKRTTPEKTNELVLRLCSVRAYSVIELSILFKRGKRWARIPVSELLHAGKLLQTIPDKPNSRLQKYYTPATNRLQSLSDKKQI